VLLAASYVFYMSWNWKFAFLILFSTVIDYAAALFIGNASTQRTRQTGFFISVAANLGTLFLFKYFNFFSESVNALVLWSEAPWRFPLHELILPVGISFYTFQTMSYTIDVYRGHIQPERHFGVFALYVTFFPQLVAGPIERASRLLPQLKNPPQASALDVRQGLGLILLGLFKKSVIADHLAPYVNEIFARPELYPPASVTLGIVFFALQIYGDFSGYSDIAAGSAQLFGIRLMRNFNAPYFARSVGEFWQRWHISLSMWFRDYVYIPLGGNRAGAFRTIRNIALTFLVSGLWHGANHTFLVWGGFHGGLLVLSRLTESVRLPLRRFFENRLGTYPVALFQMAVTFTLVCAGWTVFRAPDLETAVFMLRRIAEAGNAPFSLALGVFPRVELMAAGLSIALLVAVEGVQRVGVLRNRWERAPLFVKFTVMQLALVYLVVFGVFAQQEFLYFQF
jgi:D-alanyl-lipoteichoic acid acyltransferase DltB (MBOAT superfamily)